MNLKKLAALTLLMSAICFTGATTAQAAPFHELSCITGYQPAEDSYTECVPIEDPTEPETAVDGCWITEDGTDVCARTGVVEEPMPIGIDETPVPIADCLDPELPCVDVGCTALEVCPEIMSSSGFVDDGSLKAYSNMSQKDNSDYLIVLGLITAVLGGVAIALNRREASKK